MENLMHSVQTSSSTLGCPDFYQETQHGLGMTENADGNKGRAVIRSRYSASHIPMHLTLDGHRRSNPASYWKMKVLHTTATAPSSYILLESPLKPPIL